MAITINETLTKQEATSTVSYCYLYEPLRIEITESDNTAVKIFIELEVLDTSNTTTVIETLPAYGEFDINPGNTLTVDLMRLAQQHFDANVYHYAKASDIETYPFSIVSKYTYNFKITSDVTTSATSVVKLPIIGGRRFQDLADTTTSTTVNLTEAAVLGVNLVNRWKDYPMISHTVRDENQSDLTPKITVNTALSGTAPCGAFLIWKSRLGGWMTWGFQMKQESQQKKYTGGIQTGLMEALNGVHYVPVNYTGLETSYTVTLKDLHLSNDELEACQSIMASPAVYLMRSPNANLELMRVTSASAPINNLSNGGDFSVSLKSISQSSHKTR